jgi:hypothetical protein
VSVKSVKETLIPQHAKEQKSSPHSLEWCLIPCTLDYCLLVGGESCTLVKQTLDLPLKLSHRPMSMKTLILVEGALPRIINADKFKKM